VYEKVNEQSPSECSALYLIEARARPSGNLPLDLGEANTNILNCFPCISEIPPWETMSQKQSLPPKMLV